MAGGDVFKRYEIKYLLTAEQYSAIRSAMEEYMRGDKYGESDICNLYCDTPSFLLARRSIDKPIYKEKLRIRSYGRATENSDVFVEIKKKYKQVVYKRRIKTDERGALSLFSPETAPVPKKQIAKEIRYFIDYYTDIAPVMFISYRREAFYDKTDEDFRMTFDRDILWRDSDLTLSSGIYGTPILPPDTVLMEVKTAAAIPMWLTKVLSAHSVYKTSFSKYGTAYAQLMQIKSQGGKEVA
ncbi:MAG: polyphosphate polymerase domain-containing protein [Roseburia sp.]|nr:polyphosphate polymerase domain-containing protein [Roseburia sp.]